MALLGNQSRINLGSGYSVGGLYSRTAAANRNTGERIRFDSQDMAQTALSRDALPLGYSGSGAYYLAQKSGEISSFEQILISSTQGLLNLAAGVNIVGSSDLTTSNTGFITGVFMTSGTAYITFSHTSDPTASGEISGATSITTALSGLAAGVVYGDGTATFEFSSSGSLAAAFYILGDTLVQITTEALLDASGGVTGTALANLTAAGSAVMAVNATGVAPLTFTAPALLLGGIVDLIAQANLITGTAAILSATGALAGDITPYTELSPQSLSDAVWTALAASNNSVGTMGEKLNAAGTAGDPWTGVIEDGMTAAEVMRLLLAIATGETTIVDNGSGNATVVFKSQDGLTDRVTADMTGSERTTVTVDTM